MTTRTFKVAALVGVAALIAGAASAQGVFFITAGKAGLGVASPAQKLHVQGVTDAKVLVENTGNIGNNSMFVLRNAGQTRFSFENSASGKQWFFASNPADNFTISLIGTGGPEIIVEQDGDMVVRGDVFTDSCSPCTSDYVFQPEYELMPLEELEAFIEANSHLPGIPSEADYQATGRVNINGRQVKLLEKIEELTLYTLQQQKVIDRLAARLEALEAE